MTNIRKKLKNDLYQSQREIHRHISCISLYHPHSVNSMNTSAYTRCSRSAMSNGLSSYTLNFDGTRRFDTCATCSLLTACQVDARVMRLLATLCIVGALAMRSIPGATNGMAYTQALEFRCSSHLRTWTRRRRSEPRFSRTPPWWRAKSRWKIIIIITVIVIIKITGLTTGDSGFLWFLSMLSLTFFLLSS